MTVYCNDAGKECTVVNSAEHGRRAGVQSCEECRAGVEGRIADL